MGSDSVLHGTAFSCARDFHHDLMRRGNIMRECADVVKGFSFSRARMPRKTESGDADKARDACESGHRRGRDFGAFNDGDFIR